MILDMIEIRFGMEMSRHGERLCGLVVVDVDCSDIWSCIGSLSSSASSFYQAKGSIE